MKFIYLDITPEFAALKNDSSLYVTCRVRTLCIMYVPPDIYSVDEQYVGDSDTMVLDHTSFLSVIHKIWQFWTNHALEISKLGKKMFCIIPPN